MSAPLLDCTRTVDTASGVILSAASFRSGLVVLSVGAGVALTTVQLSVDEAAGLAAAISEALAESKWLEEQAAKKGGGT